jgi:hypothetical protein
VEINADDTETDVATELARTEVEALMVFGKAKRLAANWSPAISRIVQSFI